MEELTHEQQLAVAERVMEYVADGMDKDEARSWALDEIVGKTESTPTEEKYTCKECGGWIDSNQNTYTSAHTGKPLCKECYAYFLKATGYDPVKEGLVPTDFKAEEPAPEGKAEGIEEPPVPAVVQKHEVVVPRETPELDIDTIKKYICPSATDKEAFAFMQLCHYRGLNPFLKEAYLIKYGNQEATMVVGKDAFTRRAETHRAFDGYQAGIIVRTENAIERREGTFLVKGEELLGGWAKVFRKDRKHPFVSEVSMSEYNTGKSSWAKLPATMIRKVALVNALREAFPSDLGGCYDRSEMGVEISE